MRPDFESRRNSQSENFIATIKKNGATDFNHTANSVQMTTRRPRGPVDNLCTPLLSSVIHDKPVERIQEISEVDGFREVR